MLQYEIDVPLVELSKKIGTEGARANYWACHDAIDTLGNLAKLINSDCGFSKKESIYFAAYKKHPPQLEAEFKVRKAAGLSVSWLTEEQIKKKYQLEHAFGGILSKQGGSMDAFRFTHDLLKYNHKKGLKIADKTTIAKTTYRQDGVTLVTTYGPTIKAKKVISRAAILFWALEAMASYFR